MRAGDEGIILFKFRYGVELVETGATLMIREGNTKCVGQIKKTYSMLDNPIEKVDDSEKENNQPKGYT